MKNQGVLLGLLVISVLFSMPIQSEQKKVYILGIVPQFEIRHIRKIWNPILHKIKEQTGITLKFVGSPTISDFEREIHNGLFDFAYMNPYHLLSSTKTQGYIPLVRDKNKLLHGVIVVRKDSNINSVNDLNDKKVAFPSPNAFGASLLIRADLDKNYNIKINPIYVKTHSSVYLNTLVKQVAAGGGVQKTLSQQNKNIRNALKVIYESPSVAPHPFTAHPRVPREIRDKIKTTLLMFKQDTIGQSLLSKIPINEIGPATMKDYTPLEKLNLDDYYIK